MLAVRVFFEPFDPRSDADALRACHRLMAAARPINVQLGYQVRDVYRSWELDVDHG